MYFNKFSKKVVFIIAMILGIGCLSAKETEVIKLIKNEYLIDYKSEIVDNLVAQRWIYKIKNSNNYSSYFEVNEESKKKTLMGMIYKSSLSSVIKRRGLKAWLFYYPSTKDDVTSAYILIKTITGSSYILINRVTKVKKNQSKLIVSDLKVFYDTSENN